MTYDSRIEWAVISNCANLVASDDICDKRWLEDYFTGLKIRKVFSDQKPVDDKDFLPDELMPKKHFGRDKRTLY
jgi:hypothetical protein